VRDGTDNDAEQPLVGETFRASGQARVDLHRLLEEQSALRRVATLVARGAEAREVFDVVCVETGRLVGATSVNLNRFTADGLNVTLAGWSLRDTHVPTGTLLPLEGDTVNGQVQRTGALSRFESYDGAEGELAEVIRQRGIRSEVGAPVIVEAHVWGALVAGWDTPEPPPGGAESRIASFAELVAATISTAARRSEEDARARASLEAAHDCIITIDRAGLIVEFNPAAERTFGYSRLEVLGRPMAELIVPPSLRDRHHAGFARYVDTGTGPVLRQKLEMPALRADGSEFLAELTIVPVELPGERLATGYLRDITQVKKRELGLRLLAEVGQLIAAATSDDRLMRDVAQRAVSGFVDCCLIDLVAEGHELRHVALAPTEPEAEPAFARATRGHGSVERLAEAARRVTTSGAEEVVAVSDEGSLATLADDEDEREGLNGFTSYACIPLEAQDGCMGAVTFARAGGSSFDEDDLSLGRDLARRIALALDNSRLSRERLRVLQESRARVLKAQDAERKRLERNLHDGAQQRLVAVGLDLETLRATVFAESASAQTELERIKGELDAILAEIREISQGLHPTLLYEAGLAAALRSLARRSPVPVDLQVHVDERPPPSVEIAAYYVVSEALTNTIKHARASLVHVIVETSGDTLLAAVTDDGVGGAVTNHGSGLVGLIDRVEALGGHLSLESAAGRGTLVAVELPLATDEAVPLRPEPAAFGEPRAAQRRAHQGIG
jgi:PAS domain S-box-containing protein